MTPPLPIRTERLVLRVAGPDDGPDDIDYYGDPEVLRYVPLPVMDRAARVERLAKLRAGSDPRVTDDALFVLVEHDGAVIGDVMLQLLGGDPPSVAEIGWIFTSRVAGRGFATEAAGAVVALAFEHYGVHRLQARLDPRNTASSRLCERLGMIHEGHLREDFLESDGTWTDTGVYGLLRREWTTR